MRATCARAITHHRLKRPKEILAELALYAEPGLSADQYGAGDVLERFERRVAAELGKEAAVFMPSGTMAQLIALRIWCERSGVPTIAYHPLSHLAVHEAHAPSMLHGLRSLHVGPQVRLIEPADLSAITDRIGAFLIELPQREIGAQLPAWEDLLELCSVARERGMQLHLDGARLWEARPHYERTHAEIAALFDTVYVSFYKGLGGIAGAMLAGDAEFIAEARTWQHRHGGRLVSIYPLALAAQRGFEERLPRMEGYRERARAVAARLVEIDGIEILPDPPHTNTFHVLLQGDRETLEGRAHAIARDRGLWVFARLYPTPYPTHSKWEFVAGDATDDVTDDEIVDVVRLIVKGN